jgi:hypothetical protein
VYTDEDVHAAVAAGLRRRGFDVMTTREAVTRLLGPRSAQQLVDQLFWLDLSDPPG